MAASAIQQPLQLSHQPGQLQLGIQPLGTRQVNTLQHHLDEARATVTTLQATLATASSTAHHLYITNATAYSELLTASQAGKAQLVLSIKSTTDLQLQHDSTLQLLLLSQQEITTVRAHNATAYSLLKEQLQTVQQQLSSSQQQNTTQQITIDSSAAAAAAALVSQMQQLENKVEDGKKVAATQSSVIPIVDIPLLVSTCMTYIW